MIPTKRRQLPAPSAGDRRQPEGERDRRVHRLGGCQHPGHVVDRHHSPGCPPAPLGLGHRNGVAGDELPAKGLTDRGPQQGVEVSYLPLADAGLVHAQMPTLNRLNAFSAIESDLMRSARLA